jgi:outer membrane protein assembly factor BamB
LSRRTRTLVAVLLVGLLVVLALPGVEGYRKIGFWLRAMFQEEPDYDALEADRAARGGSAGETGHRAEAAEPYWTDFRGPGRLGIYDETPVLEEWPAEGLRLLWKQPVGAGYGSVTVAEGLVFSFEQRRDDEALVAYDLATGAEVWLVSWPARFDEVSSGEGPRSTPTYADGRVFVLGASGELRCVEAGDGSAVWRLDVLDTAGADNLMYGLSATPLVVGELLIVATGQPREGGHGLLALERETGEVVWRALDDDASYASPMLAELGGTTQVLVVTAGRVVGLEPSQGALLWEHPWEVMNGLSCSQPISLGPSRLLLSAGYGKGSAAIELESEEGRWSVRELWRSSRMKNRFNSSVLLGGHAYGLDDGVLACIDVETGQRVWKGGRYGYGQVLLAGDHLLVLAEDGSLALVRATPEGYDERHRFTAIEGLTMNIPAAAHGRLLVRNKLEMACYELWPGAAEAAR